MRRPAQFFWSNWPQDFKADFPRDFRHWGGGNFIQFLSLKHIGRATMTMIVGNCHFGQELGSERIK